MMMQFLYLSFRNDEERINRETIIHKDVTKKKNIRIYSFRNRTKVTELNNHFVLEECSYTISDIDGNHNVINLRECPDVQNYIFNDEPSDKDINMFNRWLSLHRNDYVLLYHGTSANIPVMTEGLRKMSHLSTNI